MYYIISGLARSFQMSKILKHPQVNQECWGDMVYFSSSNLHTQGGGGTIIFVPSSQKWERIFVPGDFFCKYG